jgi:HK97 family phage portal protein
MTLAIEDAAQRLGVAAFKHGGNRPGVLSTDQQLSKEDQQRLSTEYNSRHGGVDNAYKTPVLFGGLKWMGTGGTLADSAVVEHRKLTREEVAAVYDIPPVLLGILDRATFSNVEELHLAFYQDTLGPWTTLIEETLYEQLIAPVPEFASDERMVEFDMAEVLKGAIAQRYEALNKAMGGPWMKVNEGRRAENLPQSDQPEADLIRFPLNMSSDPAKAEEGGTPNARA